ncbi:MAG: site-2 protease family protein [Methanoregulaceae archaeon]|nr:site-2 protease family protein [Methanoregulaceae archaeon]
MSRSPLEVGLSIVVILLSIALHEYAHAKTADAAGDPTPRMMGRVTLNPLAHLDSLGTLFIFITVLVGFGIGWGKPVMVMPNKMRNPRWDHFFSVLAGPMTNLMLAGIFAIIFRILSMTTTMALDLGNLSYSDPIPLALFLGVVINVGLFFFNLIPIGPLDGHWLVGAFLPDPQRLAWYKFNRGPGTVILFILIILNSNPELSILGRVLWPTVGRVAGFFLGF